MFHVFTEYLMSFEGLWFTFVIFPGSLGLGGGAQRYPTGILFPPVQESGQLTRGMGPPTSQYRSRLFSVLTGDSSPADAQGTSSSLLCRVCWFLKNRLSWREWLHSGTMETGLQARAGVKLRQCCILS